MKFVTHLSENWNVLNWPERFISIFGWFATLTILAYAAFAASKLEFIPEISVGNKYIPQPLAFIFFIVSLVYWIWAFLHYQKWVKANENTKKKQTHNGTGETKKTTVHVLLPLSGNTAKGDGLIQAAGVMAAGDEYDDSINLEIIDHKNDVTVAVRALREIMRRWKKGDSPLWVVSTMSLISINLHETIKFELQQKEELRQFFTMIFTVASSPNVPHDPENRVFKYTVHGTDEVEKILTYLDGDRLKKPLIIAGTDSAYPKAAVGQLAHSLSIDSKNPPVLILPLDENGKGKVPDKLKGKLAVLEAEYAIIFGYDLALFEAFKLLITNGFTGKILSPTTLSVPDWQQYLSNQTELTKNGNDYYCIRFKNSDKDKGASYVAYLTPWTFNKLTDSKELYKDRAGEEIRAKFNTVEKEVYQKINSNYISALCYDSIRIIHSCIAKRITRFETLDELGIAEGPLGEIVPLVHNGVTVGFKPNAKMSIAKVNTSIARD